MRSRKSRFVTWYAEASVSRRETTRVLIALEITFSTDCGRKFGWWTAHAPTKISGDLSDETVYIASSAGNWVEALRQHVSASHSHIRAHLPLTMTSIDLINYIQSMFEPYSWRMICRYTCDFVLLFLLFSLGRRYFKQQSRAIAGRTARCRCKFRYVSNCTISRQWNVLYVRLNTAKWQTLSTHGLIWLAPKLAQNTLNHV